MDGALGCGHAHLHEAMWLDIVCSILVQQTASTDDLQCIKIDNNNLLGDWCDPHISVHRVLCTSEYTAQVSASVTDTCWGHFVQSISQHGGVGKQDTLP